MSNKGTSAQIRLDERNHVEKPLHRGVPVQGAHPGNAEPQLGSLSCKAKLGLGVPRGSTF